LLKGNVQRVHNFHFIPENESHAAAEAIVPLDILRAWAKTSIGMDRVGFSPNERTRKLTISHSARACFAEDGWLFSTFPKIRTKIQGS
jgi:hypothetical protein